MWSQKTKMSGVFCSIIISLLLNFDGMTLTQSQNTHIISFVAQRKTNPKYGEINDFDFESFGNENKNSMMNGGIERSLKLLNSNSPTIGSESKNGQEKFGKLQRIDDSSNIKENTLENTDSIIIKDVQNETINGLNNSDSSTNHRFKQSIHVLKPVKDLVNTVRDGGFNHTTHFNKTQHHLVSPNLNGGETSVIETEAEREMANNGPDLKVLDFFGNFIFGFLKNIVSFFAGSSGNASALSSAG